MTDTLTDTEYRDMIAAERAEFAATLGDLTEQQWDAPTLCAGWRVREVVAHMTMPFRLSLPRFVFGVLRDRGNFDRMADRTARRDTARLSAADLLGCLEDNVHHPWKPPGGGYEGALIHDLVHSLDITIPLGIDQRLPDDQLAVLTRMGDQRGIRYFGVDLTGVQLRADDLDWAFGTGEPLCGPAQDLALVVFGRRLPAGRLRGAAAARFTAG
jgi:uncharacterized protein (TIGR03083 family)